MDQFDFENKKRRRLKKGPLMVIACLLCLVIGGLGGYFIAKPQSTFNGDQDIYHEVLKYIEEDFYDTTESDYDLQTRILAGMVSALGDIHSSFMTREQSNELDTSINGSFEGIGISFISIDAGALILEVFKGSPADNSGMKSGDLITHVEGTSIAGFDSDHIKEMILGKEGSHVSLDVLRNGKKQSFSVVRGSVESSASYEIRKIDNKKIGYIRLTTFGSATSLYVEEALEYFTNEGVQNICIDLRGNGGGYLTAVKQILDLFITENQVMYKTEKKDVVTEIKATNREKYTFEKGFVLVDGDSASASEVMTSALSEVLHYQIIGTKTYGKGTAQDLITLSDGSTLRITTARWLTSQGTWVHNQGITPDKEVKELSIADYSYKKLEKSYQYDQVASEIANMQRILKQLGYQVDRTDGYFSQETKKALQTFEKDYGLKVDGILTNNDFVYLLSALSYNIYQKMPDRVYQEVEKNV